MRNCVFVFVFFLLCIGCAMPEIAKDSDLNREKIFQFQNCKADKIYEYSRLWFAEEFGSAKKIIEYENKETFTLVGKISIPTVREQPLMTVGGFAVRMTITINCKDNMSRIQLKNMEFVGAMGPEILVSDVKILNPKLDNLYSNYINYIASKQNEKPW